jgi:hypothetical protein
LLAGWRCRRLHRRFKRQDGSGRRATVPANRLRRVTLFIGVSPLTRMFLPD